MAALPALVLDAADFGVRADGRSDDATALQRALAEVAGRGGGTLRLGPGRYGLAQTLALPSGVRILGTDQQATLLDLVGNQSLIDLQDCVEGVVQGLRFEGRGRTLVDGRGGVYGSRGTQSGPLRCQVLDNVMVGLGTCGIALDNAVGVLVRGNQVTRSAEHGIYLSGDSHDCVVEGNRVDVPGTGLAGTVAGIKLANPGCSGNRVQGNIISAPQAEGLLCDAGAVGNMLLRNDIRQAARRGVRLNRGADRNEVRSNLVRDAGMEGMRDFGGRDNRFTDNTIDSPRAGAGIRLDAGSTGAVVEGNSVLAVAPDGWGIDVAGCRQMVRGNFLSPSVRYDIRLPRRC